jgi:hypothetical protein
LASSDKPPAHIVEELYLVTFCRFPTAEETQALVAELEKPNVNRRQWIEDVLWSMLNSPEFTHKD